MKAIPEFKAQIKTFKDEHKTLVKRPDPALEYHGRMLLREQNIKCRSDTTVIEIFSCLCDCVEKLQETAELWKKRAKVPSCETRTTDYEPHPNAELVPCLYRSVAGAG